MHQKFFRIVQGTLSTVGLLTLLPNSVFAQGLQTAPPVQQATTQASVAIPSATTGILPQTLHAPLFFLLVALIPILFLMLAEYSLVTTAHHKHDEIETSKKIIMYSLISLLVIFFAFIVIDSTLVILH